MPGEGLPAALQVALAIGKTLDGLGIGYFLGGSLASSLQGEPRATNDIDLVVDLQAEQVSALARALGSDFDIDEESRREATQARSSWNVFHLPTALKVDLFVLRDTPFDRSEFERRQRVEIAAGASLSIKSPEDTVLRKLLWYRQGGEVATQQWRDVVQVLRILQGSLDTAYLEAWAPRLSVADLLRRAQEAAAAS